MTVRVLLTHGIWRDGGPLIDAELRELTGADEEALSRLPEDMPISNRVSELLARTVIRIGDISSVTNVETRALSVGDRERLLFHQYAENFARTVKLNADCVECGEQIDANVAISDLLVATNGSGPLSDYELITEAGQVRFRLPQGADQEFVAPVAQEDLDQACNLLIQRCIVQTSGDLDASAMREALEERFAELDPQAETLVQLVCPSCESPTTILVDGSTLLFDRLATNARLLDEVDAIAQRYHWSEREILGLSTARRRAYLQRVADWAVVE